MHTEHHSSAKGPPNDTENSSPSWRELNDAIDQRHEASDRRMLYIAVLLIGMVNFGFIVDQCEMNPDGGLCPFTVTVRFSLLAIALVFVIAARYLKKVSHLQIGTLAWMMITSTLFVVADSYIPSNADQQSLADLAYLIAIFVFVPCRLSYQIISGVYFTVIHVIMLFQHGGFNHLWWEAALIFPVATICGAYISWRIRLTRIDELRQWQNQRDAYEELKVALEKIDTLRGLLPICAYCKKVRDDKGYWHEVESFIRRHSPAEFSHSLCPECGQEHYPDLLCEEDFDEHRPSAKNPQQDI
ncbi:MAG: hypothetical protein AAFX93_03475 [Verrucomicrobiota bacterium]